jgi:hypothetical protein
MAREATASVDTEAELAKFIAQFAGDPYGFVMAVYPWGVKGTSLERKKGPEPWQRDLLLRLGEHIRLNATLKALGCDYRVWRSAVASGHGVGKSALVAWIIHFMMSTRVDTRGVVTANTGNQLETKTWPELAKWHQLLLCKHWFRWTASSYTFAQYPEEKQKNYMVSAQTVSEQNTEAFAGLHNEGKAVFAIFDEASGITSNVWQVVDGAFTDGEGFFFCFGNPTRPDGEFADCFDKHKDVYTYLRHVDSREVSHTNKAALMDIILKNGADSDAARIRVYGQFPNQAFDGFISMSLYNDCVSRELIYDQAAPVIIGADVARYGDDATVFTVRQGNDARSHKQIVYRGLNNIQVADRLGELANRLKADAIVIESVGPGVGVIDIMRDRKYRVISVHPGAPASDHLVYANKRMEMWVKARDWMQEAGCLPEDPVLMKQMTRIKYGIERRTQRQIMEPKEDYKQRNGGESPDAADSFVLTFAVNIARKDRALSKGADNRHTAVTDYEPMTH